MQNPARLVFPSFQFGLHDPDMAVRLVELGVGGFCLYGGELGEIAALTEKLQARAPAPLLFCGDYEDGLASHVAGGVSLPSNMGIGASGDEAWAYQKGSITGHQAKAIGVRWVFAPVVDLAGEAGNPIVNTRAFGDDPKLVVRMTRAFLRGLKDQGVLGCLKHFPGHGRTTKDSHLDLPIIKASRAELEKSDLVPFRELAAEAGAVMTAHLIVPSMVGDRKTPYSLSDDVEKTLRGELGFKGLVTTDALNMKAISARFPEFEAGRRAMLGGADILLVPAKPEELVRDLVDAMERDEALAETCGRSLARLEAAIEALGPRAPADAAKAKDNKYEGYSMVLANDCMAWPREPEPPLPKEFFYWEPDADSPEEWQGAKFIDILRSDGRTVLPCDGKKIPKGATLVVGCFLSPRAYTGKIAYDKATTTKIAKLLKSAQRSLIVSFGSPFVFEAFPVGGLCAFSKNEFAQYAAAMALHYGKIKKGLMPVKLKPAL